MFELAGFSTVRNEGIRVSLGFTATVNARVEGRLAAGIGHGDRPVAGGRHLGHVDRQHLRRQAAVGAADLARLLLAAGAVAGGADESHRRRRQHQRHAAGLHGLWHHRPGPRDLRGHQRHGEHRRVRQLPRRRRHGGSADEHGRALGRSVDAGRADAVHQQVGRQPVPRHVLRRLLAGELAGVQHRRRSDRARPHRRRRPRSRGRQPPLQLPGRQRRLRRLRDQGSPVVVRVVPAPGHQGAVRQLPRHAAADHPQQLQRQGHLQPDHQQQVHRLHAAVAEEAAAALRLVPARRRHRPQHGGVDAGTRTSGRGCTRANGTAC